MMTVDGIEIPRDVEAAGGKAIDAFVKAKTTKPKTTPKE